ncbi:MAG: type II toxin-antitoxin system PemK/MazF family toxin [Phyllobacteriaceae bacterium]|nr:type II toxin-antitoxin system PemK/MazF family toxin [Phyllobacteriaceae bacterium]
MTTTIRTGDGDWLAEGEIVLADLGPVRGTEQDGVRPVVVVSVDSMNARSRRVIICPITSNRDVWRTKLALPDGMKTSGMVLTDQIRAIDTETRMLRRIERVPPEFLQLLRSYVGRWIGLELPDR